MHCFLCILQYSFAQRHQFKHITNKDGLTQSVVISMMKDSKGFLWMSSWDGISRYDGITIKSNHQIAPGLENFDRVSEIKEDQYGNVWFGGQDALIQFSYKDNRFRKYKPIAQTEKENIQSLFYLPHIISGDKILINYEPGNLYIFDITSKTFTPCNQVYSDSVRQIITKPIKEAENFVDKLILSIEEKDSTFFFILKKRDNELIWQKYATSNIFQSVFYNRIDGDELVIFASQNTKEINEVPNVFFTYNTKTGKEKKFTTEDVILSSQKVENKIYIGTKSKGIYIIDNETFQKVDSIVSKSEDPFSLLNNNVSQLYYKDNILWCSNWGAGVSYSKMSEPKLSYHFSTKEATSVGSNNFIRGIVEDDNGHFWCATQSGGIVAFDNNLKYLSTIQNLNSKEFPSIYITSRQELLFGSVGLKKYNVHEKMLTTIDYNYIKRKPSNLDKEFNTFTKDRSGNIYAANVSGLWLYNEQDKNIMPLKNINNCSFDNIYEFAYFTKDNRIFAFSISTGITEWALEGNYIRLVRRLNLSYFLRSVYEESNKIIWLGTSGGLIEYDLIQNKILHHYTMQHGLPNNTVYSILPDDFGYLWLSTNKGLARFDTKHRSFKRFTHFDIESNKEYNRNAACKAKDGRLLFGSIDGITVVKPWINEQLNTSAQLQLTSVKSKNNHNPYIHRSQASALVLEKKVNYIEFQFQVIEYINPRAYKIYYKLNGVNHDWVMVDNPSNARFANLAPGTYNFELKCSLEDEVPCDDYIAYYFVVPALWYQTLAFKFFASILVLSSIGYIIKLRIDKRINLANAALEKEKAVLLERENIIADLHDDIGASLSSIHINSELAEKIQETKPEVLKKLLFNISTQSKDISNKLSDFIWMVKQESQNTIGLKQKILDYQSFLFEEKKIHFIADIDEHNIPKSKIKILYLIVKESLNNTAKYAQATEVVVSCKRNHDILTLIVKDNGNGFDSKVKSTGNGLGNIAQRSMASGGKFSIESSIGNGTLIKCEWPLL